MDPITWKYRCSICGELLHPDNVTAHLEEEKAKDSWPGHMTWTRVDDDEESGNGTDPMQS